LKCILHIGQQKTGSTFLQYRLSQTRSHLAEQGYLYPSSLGNQKQNKFLTEHDKLRDSSSEVYKEFENEIAQSGLSNIICSEENLFSIPKEKITTVHAFLKNFFDEFEIVVYLRRQDDHFLSIYQQNVRGKTTESINEILSNGAYAEKYSYNKILENWSGVFQNAKIKIRPYGQLKNNDIIEDFYDLMKIEKGDFTPEDNYAITNKSFDAESIELIRYFNILEKEGKLILPHQTKRKLRIFLKNKERTNKFSLSINDKLKIWKIFLVENKKFCAKYLDDNQSTYFLNEPSEKNTQPLYNHHIQSDHLYELYFDIFES